MGVTVNTNIPSIAASRALYTNRGNLEQAMERLASGKRLNSASDDAAGMTVVTRMKAQITSLNQAVRNTNDAISLVSTYDGAADEIEDILIRMRELATLAQNGTYTLSDSRNANLEFQALKDEINRVASKTKFNGELDVASAASEQNYSFQVGFAAGDLVSIGFDRLDFSALAFNATAGGATAIAVGITAYDQYTGGYSSLTTFVATDAVSATKTDGVLGSGISNLGNYSQVVSNASYMTVRLDAALSNLNVGRAEAGAIVNRLEHTVTNLMSVIQRTEEARSRIEDADFASESASLARSNVLAQAGSAMLAQANQSSQYVLTLLRG